QRLTAPHQLSVGDELCLDRIRFRLATAYSGGAQATVFSSADEIRTALAQQQAPLQATEQENRLAASPIPIPEPVMAAPPAAEVLPTAQPPLLMPESDPVTAPPKPAVAPAADP